MNGLTTTGEGLLDLLTENGVDLVFGVPGNHTVALYRGFAGGGFPQTSSGGLCLVAHSAASYPIILRTRMMSPVQPQSWHISNGAKPRRFMNNSTWPC